MVIDGQQRTTSTMLLLASIRHQYDDDCPGGDGDAGGDAGDAGVYGEFGCGGGDGSGGAAHCCVIFICYLAVMKVNRIFQRAM